jgi:hypothetical protein
MAVEYEKIANRKAQPDSSIVDGDMRPPLFAAFDFVLALHPELAFGAQHIAGRRHPRIVERHDIGGSGLPP